MPKPTVMEFLLSESDRAMDPLDNIDKVLKHLGREESIELEMLTKARKALEKVEKQHTIQYHFIKSAIEDLNHYDTEWFKDKGNSRYGLHAR